LTYDLNCIILKLVTLKEGGKAMGKHHEYTTEPSNPHTGSIGKEHVDLYHYGKGGEEVGRTYHVTDPGTVHWGRVAKEHREKQKSGSGK